MNLPRHNFDTYVFSKQSDYDEPTFRKEFAKAMQNLRTVVVYCYDPRIVDVPAAVAKEFGEVYPGDIVTDEQGNKVATTTTLFGSSAEFVGKTVFHRRLRRPRCSPSLKASLASSAAAPALTLGCAPRCRLVWAMGNGASGGGSGHRV